MALNASSNFKAASIFKNFVMPDVSQPFFPTINGGDPFSMKGLDVLWLLSTFLLSLHLARDSILCALPQIGFAASIYRQVKCLEMVGIVFSVKISHFLSYCWCPLSLKYVSYEKPHLIFP